MRFYNLNFMFSYRQASTIINKGNNKLPSSEQYYKRKVKIKTHYYINRQNQSTTGKL